MKISGYIVKVSAPTDMISLAWWCINMQTRPGKIIPEFGNK